MRLFFSRTIGLSEDGEAIPILAGTRLTGRQGRYSLGVLNVQQREQGLSPATNFRAVRLRSDILANSDIGGILLNREENGPRYAVPGRGRDYATRASANYQDRRWTFRGRFDDIGERFNDENTKMFLNALLQYNTDSQQWSSNLRFNIIHRPLSDIFLVYNERRDERTGNLLDRAFVAKMTYLMAF